MPVGTQIDFIMLDDDQLTVSQQATARIDNFATGTGQNILTQLTTDSQPNTTIRLPGLNKIL